MFPTNKSIMRGRLRLTAQHRSRGVTLIEVLVGIVIGMVGMLVIFQTVSVWDARTRVSTSSGDAQISGSLAMFNLERDIRLAGMGFGTAGSAELGCVVNSYDNAASGAGAALVLRPVNIVFGGEGTAVPDTIEVMYGDSPYFAKLQQFTGGSTSQMTASPSKYGFKRGDVVVMTNASNNCNLVQITDDTAADDSSLTFGTGTYTDFYTGAATPVRWNSASASAPPISAGNLYNLGPSPRDDLWSVNTSSGTLAYVNGMGANPTESFGVAEGVINLKAYYGCDANGDGKIDNTEWQNTAPTDWTRVRAIRVALLVRGQDYSAPPASNPEAPNFKSPNPSYLGIGGAMTLFAMTNVDGTPDSGDVGPNPNNWRYYRYRVYEKEIPLRNMMWGQSPPTGAGGC